MKKYFLLILVGFLGFVACNKERDTLQEKGTELSNVVARESIVEPVLSDGVLWFDDAESVDMYYDYLDNLYETSTKKEGEVSVLAKEEMKFRNFVSLRSTFEKAEDQEDPFDKDDVQMSMLNANSEIGFGKYLYFLRLGERYKVPKDNAASIAAVRAYPKEELLPDDILLNYDIEVLNSNWQKTTIKSGGPTTVWPPVLVTDRDECQAGAVIQKVGDECANQSRDAKVTVGYTPKDVLPGTKNYGVLISWGDGSPQTDEPTNEGMSTFTHHYTVDGTYNVRIQVFGQGSCSGVKVLDKTVVLEYLSCKRKQITHYDTDCVSDNGNWKLDLKTWNELSASGKREKVFARACSYKWKRNKWRKRWHWKKVSVDAKWRHKNDCGVSVSEDCTEQGYGDPCRRVKVVFKKWANGAWHKNGDVTSFARFPLSDNCELTDELIFCE